MQFRESIRGNAGSCVDPVDVLAADEANDAMFDECNQGHVRVRGRHEPELCIEFGRRLALALQSPNATRAPKVGDAARRRDARPREDGDAS